MTRGSLADTDTVSEAISVAEKALPDWKNTPPLRRARVMSRLKQLMEGSGFRICEMITTEHGNALSDATGELQRGIENAEYASYAPELLNGEHSRNVGPGIE